MPSRQLSTSQPPPPNQPQNLQRNRHNTHHHRILAPLIASAASACSFVVLVLLCIRNRTRRKKQRTTPSSDTDSTLPHRFSYSLLRRATNSFSTTLGHGGFGPVFSGSLAGKPVAVKLMDSSVSLQGEREFHNELFFASRLLRSSCHHVVPAIGFAVDPKRRRFLIVYDLMHNGNLHDALLRRKCPELLRWEKRFSVAVDVAKGIQYLHSCDPQVIHGDIKPSNVLLDHCFEAKIGDFGLARLKTEAQIQVEVFGGESEIKRKEELESDGGSVFEEQSPESFVAGTSPVDVAVASPSEVEGVKKNGKGVSGDLVNEGNEVAGTVVKDYVIDWIGNEVGKEREKGEWVDSTASTSGKEEDKNNNKNKMKNSGRRKLEWWESMDEEMSGAGVLKKERRRPVREWWKEEYSAELEKKKKKKKKKKNKQKGRKGAESDGDNGDSWWFRDDANLYSKDVKKMKRNSSRNSLGSVDSWLDGMSGELRRARGNSYDSCSGEIIPKSGGISSNQSMRGTVFYVAPEYGYSGGDVSEKCDVYSYGVLLLVIVSGRRPLQVTGSPLSEFQRANLVSWARLCARNGKLLDLVDQSIEFLDKDQALLCIRVALLCLLKSPARRPSMKEVVGMLTGEWDPPQLPVEYSSSHLPLKSTKEVLEFAVSAATN